MYSVGTPQEISPAIRLDIHKSRVQDCGKYSLIVCQETPVGRFFIRYPVHCSSRYCQECARRRAELWRRKIAPAFTVRKCVFMTLTFDSRSPDPLIDPKYYSHAWETFLKRLRRRYPSLKFARFVELHKSGKPHFHILVDRYIPRKYIRWAFRDCGGGIMGDIRYIDTGRATQYITKYLTKSFTTDQRAAEYFFISRMRSVSTSKGLYYLVPKSGTCTFYSLDILDKSAQVMQHLSCNLVKGSNNEYISGSRSPPFIWIPNANMFDYNFPPSMQFELTYEMLRAWQFDTSHLPTDGTPIVY